MDTCDLLSDYNHFSQPNLALVCGKNKGCSEEISRTFFFSDLVSCGDPDKARRPFGEKAPEGIQGRPVLTGSHR